MNKFSYLSILLLLFMLATPRGMVWAQSAFIKGDGGVEFRCYAHMGKDLMHSIRQNRMVEEAPGMQALREQAMKVQESGRVEVNLLKGKKKKTATSQWVEKRRESILKVCIYKSATVRPEMVTFFATAVALTEDGICLTNYHVLDQFINPQAKIQPGDSLMFVATDDGRTYPITQVLSYNRLGDVALFRVDMRGEKLTPMPVGEDQPVAATVHTLTHPESMMYYYSRGVVTRNVCDNVNDPFTCRTQITADYAKGSSGGPIFDDYGNMIAMVSTTNSIYAQPQTQQNLQMVVKTTIPISVIRRLIK